MIYYVYIYKKIKKYAILLIFHTFLFDVLGFHADPLPTKQPGRVRPWYQEEGNNSVGGGECF